MSDKLILVPNQLVAGVLEDIPFGSTSPGKDSPPLCPGKWKYWFTGTNLKYVALVGENTVVNLFVNPDYALYGDSIPVLRGTNLEFQGDFNVPFCPCPFYYLRLRWYAGQLPGGGVRGLVNHRLRAQLSPMS